MLVVIPYYAPGAQGRELELAITGWRKYCKTPFHIAIISDTDPHIEGDDISFVYAEHAHDIDGSYTPHLDFVRKFRAAHAAFPNESGCVFAADDNYPVYDFDISWLKQLRYNTDVPFFPQHNGWSADKYFTRCKEEDLKIPTRNWSTHVPCWFDFDKLISMFDRFNMDSESYVLEDLYFNLYHAGEPAELDCNCKYFMTEQCHVVDLPQMINQKVWICNAVDGWSKEMEQILFEYYG